MNNSGYDYVEVCPAGCQSGFRETDIMTPEGPLKQCPECGHLVSRCSEDLYWKSMKEFDDPKGTLPSGTAAVRLLRHTKKLLKKIERLLGKNRKEIHLLDVGCSSGAFISTVGDLGVDAAGVEPSRGPVKTAIESGLKVYQGYLNDIQFPGESFDVVTLFEVIEHLKEPLGLIKECRRILRRGGLLVIRTGNADSWTVRFMKSRWDYFSISEHGGHISFFTPQSIKKIAERSGFLVEDIKTRRVSFYKKVGVPAVCYRSAKLVAELLNRPAVWSGKGHELLAFLKKPY